MLISLDFLIFRLIAEELFLNQLKKRNYNDNYDQNFQIHVRKKEAQCLNLPP
jgi:hypothetical protein